ncbi:MAG TPA: glycosyltransferase family 1 protein [Thermodesulfobacteriota bacterium]|nr:glycosyltransferase family 1 protein [Thermodesulfobacteriota bacterium]
MRVSLVRNVKESRSLSMSLYADCLRDALVKRCDVEDVRLRSDLVYRMAGIMGLRIQDYVGRFWSFPRQLREMRSDVFHIVDHANAHLLRVLDPERTVVTCHDLMLLKLEAGEIPLNGSRPLVAGRAFRWSVGHIQRARAVLCVSQSTMRDVIRFLGCPLDRLHVVYNGVHRAFRKIQDHGFLSEGRKRLGIDWHMTVLHVGGSGFYKNLEGIIESLAVLPSGRHGGVHLVKVGENFTPTQWELVRRLRMGDSVHYLGKLNVYDLVVIYNLSDLLLFPSLYEGFGWPPLEAMACGTPVVCSDRGSLKEVVGEAAVIVDPEDPKDIADGVERVLTDSGLRKTLVNRGLERARLFNWKTTAEGILRVYEEVIGA